MALTLREEAKKFLADVPEQYVFWVNDGRILKNMKELGEALGSMSEETFVYHANAEKNDFATWVREVIGDGQLAKDLLKASTRARAAKQVASRLSLLNKRLS